VEASALHAPPAAGRIAFSPAFLRLRSDEQLVALFRKGDEDAFSVIHDRYRQRLFSYVRQMLGARSRQDAEDVLQDVFIRAYGSLRADGRPLALRAWLYRVAHNRCVDVLRRPTPAPADVFEVSRKPLHDPIEVAQRRDDLARLVRDVSHLPEHQRSALLMREIDGMPYTEIADALAVTVPAVKSLLVRARMGLVEAQEARDLDCSVVREDLLGAYDRGVRASGRARRHMRECSGCREYRTALRGMRRSFAALAPAGLGPLALAAKALGLGGAGGGAAASAGGSAAGGAAAMAGGGMATATACKVAAVVCTAAIGAGGAVEVRKLVRHENPARNVPAPATAPASGSLSNVAPIRGEPLLRQQVLAPAPVVREREQAPAAAPGKDTSEPVPVDEPLPPVPIDDEPLPPDNGGTLAPDELPPTTATPGTLPGEADPGTAPAAEESAVTEPQPVASEDSSAPASATQAPDER